MNTEAISEKVRQLVGKRDRAKKRIQNGDESSLSAYKYASHEIRGIIFTLNKLGVRYWANCTNEFRISYIRFDRVGEEGK